MLPNGSKGGLALRTEHPNTAEQAAEVLAAADSEGLSVRPRGAGTKLGWGGPGPEAAIELTTAGLTRIVEHNAPDLTAVVEAGVPLADAQSAFRRGGLMVALDPPLGRDEAATVGGVVATGDSGPLRHRYGAPRDLLLGMTVALADGTVAHAGGKVIKNVAGYDLTKLLAGSFGTLGLVVRVALRLHPLSAKRVTASGSSADPVALQRSCYALAHAPLELESLDISWEAGTGQVLARCTGAAPQPRAEQATRLMQEAGLRSEIVEDDEQLWSRQRERQRSENGTVVRVSGRASEVARVIETASSLGGSVVGRAAMGLLWVALPPADPAVTVATIEQLRRELHPLPCVILDAPREAREGVDVWGKVEPGAAALMRRVKERFDPRGILNPGLFVDGI
ncbi:MAG: FAD-binding protein [Nitriliruptorales bacterium]|nr:FAD-binding protein [Nitriliruptorales bacterium]